MRRKTGSRVECRARLIVGRPRAARSRCPPRLPALVQHELADRSSGHAGCAAQMSSNEGDGRSTAALPTLLATSTAPLPSQAKSAFCDRDTIFCAVLRSLAKLASRSRSSGEMPVRRSGARGRLASLRRGSRKARGKKSALMHSTMPKAPEQFKALGMRAGTVVKFTRADRGGLKRCCTSQLFAHGCLRANFILATDDGSARKRHAPVGIECCWCAHGKRRHGRETRLFAR